MNILFFTQSFAFGGNDAFLLDLVAHWPNQQDMLVISTNQRPGVERYQLQAAQLTNVKFVLYKTSSLLSKAFMFFEDNLMQKYGPLRPIINVAGHLLFKLALHFTRKPMMRIVRKYNIGCYFSNSGGYPAGIYNLLTLVQARALGVKLTCCIIHNFTTCYTRQGFWGAMSAHLNICCDKVFTVSKAVASDLENKTYFSHVCAIYNGIPIVDKPAAYSLAIKHKKNIAIVGRIEPRKGHRYLLEVLPEIRRQCGAIGVFFVGEGNDHDVSVLKQLAKSLDLDGMITWLGYSEHAREMIGTFDFLVFPSVEYESFGLVILEAWLYSRPVVAFATGGVPEVIENGEGGILVEGRNSKKLAAACIRLLQDGEYCSRLGGEGYQRLKQKFDIRLTARAYYEAVIEDGS